MITGYKCPLEIDPATNSLAIATDAEYIQQQIETYVFTERGERLGLPGYGMENTLFKSVQDAGFIANTLQRGLTKAIPQAVFSVVGTVNDMGELLLTIEWIYSEGEPNSLFYVLTNG